MARKPKLPRNEIATDADLDPIIEGLLLRLPAAGTYWAPQEQQQWITLLTGAFKVLYKDKPESESDI